MQSNHLLLSRLFLSSFIAMIFTVPAIAQQSFHNTSAAQPSPGVMLFRQTYEFTQYGDDPTELGRRTFDFHIHTQLAYGISKEVAVIGMWGVTYRDQDSNDASPEQSFSDYGQGDFHAMVKWRVWKLDTGPIDTMRLSVLFGLDFPTGEDPFGNDGWDPMIGAVFTSIQGRHGVNAAVRWKFNTHQRDDLAVTHGDLLEDMLHIDTAYLYRITPAEFSMQSNDAWYVMAELNGVYETNGDIEFLFAPGIMYEARKFVFEASVQVPVFEDVDNRLRKEWSIGIGFRYLF